MIRPKNFTKPKRDKDIFIYGKHPVIAALKNKNRNIKKIFIAQESRIMEKEILSIIKDYQLNATLEVTTRKHLDNMLGKNTKHQGIMIQTIKLQAISYKKIFSEKNLKFGVLLDKITDPNNVGAIYRSAFNFNLDFVINLDKGTSKENPSLLNSACGNFEKINTFQSSNLINCVKEFKKNDWWVIGTDIKANLNIHEFFSFHSDIKKILIILGSEGYGIRNLTKEHCDFMVKIQMKEEKSSLNVSNAAAIFFYEIQKNLQLY